METRSLVFFGLVPNSVVGALLAITHCATGLLEGFSTYDYDTTYSVHVGLKMPGNDDCQVRQTSHVARVVDNKACMKKGCNHYVQIRQGLQ